MERGREKERKRACERERREREREDREREREEGEKARRYRERTNIYLQGKRPISTIKATTKAAQGCSGLNKKTLHALGTH